jgi:hypothetical protein
VLNTHGDVVQVIHDYMSDPGTAWLIGERATFSRTPDEDAEVTLDHAGGAIVAQDGAVRITAIARTRLAPMEGLTARSWSQAALLCQHDLDASMAQRGVLTELGSDMMAARPTDRIGILFDLGLGAAEADYCVRTSSTELRTLLRTKVGESISGEHAFLDEIAAAGADYVALSKLGRIERFGERFPQPRGLELLAPAGYRACMTFAPPQQDADAVFDDATYGAFRVLYGIFADPVLVKLKEAVAEAIRDKADPNTITINNDEERTAVRVALRQLERKDGISETLTRWRRAFDG